MHIHVFWWLLSIVQSFYQSQLSHFYLWPKTCVSTGFQESDKSVLLMCKIYRWLIYCSSCRQLFYFYEAIVTKYTIGLVVLVTHLHLPEHLRQAEHCQSCSKDHRRSNSSSDLRKIKSHDDSCHATKMKSVWRITLVELTQWELLVD